MTEPIHIISLGAGVQSSTMALMAAAGEITPMPLAAIFADTGDEPAAVYKWLDWLEKQLPYPVHRVSKGRLSDLVTRVRISKNGNAYSKPGIPAFMRGAENGMMQRQCTLTLKVEPVRSIAKKIAGRKTPINMWLGISMDELRRMKPSRDKRITNTYPLIDKRMSRSDCLTWMAAKGYPTPPRSACVYCPYHNDHEWKRIRDESPSEFAGACAFEKRLQATYAKLPLDGVPFLHESRQPLESIDFDELTATPLLPKNNMNNECEGMCGV